MTTQNRLTLPALLFAAITLATPGVCEAQTVGYINGSSSLSSFNASTGAILNSFTSGGGGTAFAVASDDTTLYLPNIVNFGQLQGQLNKVSGKTGQVINTLAFAWPGQKAVLSSDGSKAYVMSEGYPSEIIVVDTSTLAVLASGTIAPPSSLGDIALSPDSKTLYVSVSCTESGSLCLNSSNICPLAKGICILDAATLSIKSQLSPLNGLLAPSEDGGSLYVTQGAQAGGGVLYTVNTTTLAISERKGLADQILGAVVVDPVSHYAVILQNNAQASTTGYLLNTSTNQIVAELFANAPGGAAVRGYVPSLNQNTAAFAPDGKSFWMIVACDAAAPPGCTTPGGAIRALAGISIPSGVLIAETALPQDATSIAFPQ